jgi:hypothetical protein
MERRALIGLKPLKTSDGAAAPQASYLRMPTVTANVPRPGGQRGVTPPCAPAPPSPSRASAPPTPP